MSEAFERIYVECHCGEPGHLVGLWRFGEDVGINVQMSPFLPWWKRLARAALYVIGRTDDCHWADTLVVGPDRARIAAFITEDPT